MMFSKEFTKNALMTIDEIVKESLTKDEHRELINRLAIKFREIYDEYPIQITEE